MIQARNITLSFGKQKIFDHVSFTFNEEQRVGLVGRNGSGKSTLLKVIAQQHMLDEGQIALLNNKKIAYMPQEVVMNSTKSVVDEAFSAFEKIISLQQESELLAKKMEDGTADDECINRYAVVAQELVEHNQAQALAETKKMLNGLGFSQAQMQGPVSELSVGWKIKLVLSKLLLQNADFYLFDEPTNHLDLFAKEWFLNFLKKSSFGFLIVCHERYFLDELCTDILELENGKGTVYHGNYSTYLVQKDARLQAQISAYTQQQKDIERKKEFVERFKASAARAKSAQSMMKTLEKMELVEPPPGMRKQLALHFGAMEQSGRIVLKVEDVAQSFESKSIFSHVSFEIERGEKVGLVAANGVGKTTLFKVITGAYSLQKGHVTFGHNVHTAVFEQDQNKVLDFNKTVLEEVEGASPKKSTAAVRTGLGAFLFSGDEVKKKIKVLSGGEKNRVAMIKVLLQDANFLLLDEPTNHLDIESKEILLQSLQNYPGTILFVSHDRDFLNDLATKIIELTPQGAHTYLGNFDSYRYQKQLAEKSIETSVPVKKQEQSVKAVGGKELFELQKMIKRTEEKLERLQAEIQRLQEDLAKVIYLSVEYNQLSEKLQTVEKNNRELMVNWEKLQQQHEALLAK